MFGKVISLFHFLIPRGVLAYNELKGTFDLGWGYDEVKGTCV